MDKKVLALQTLDGAKSVKTWVNVTIYCPGKH
jgi:hypothetical protein